MGDSNSCTQLCGSKMCLSAWATNVGNKCGTFNVTSYGTKFKISTCHCSKQ